MPKGIPNFVFAIIQETNTKIKTVVTNLMKTDLKEVKKNTMLKNKNQKTLKKQILKFKVSNRN